jgi:hypothetical protein
LILFSRLRLVSDVSFESGPTRDPVPWLSSSLKARLLTSRGSLTTDPTAVPVYLHFEGSQQVPF